MTIRKTTLALLVFLCLTGTALAGGAAKSALTRPDDGPDDDAKGFVKMKANSGAELLEVKIAKVDKDETYDVYLEDGDGVMQDVGDIEGNGKWKLNTRRGDELPFDVESAADLADRAVEIRNSEGETVLEGSVPASKAGKSKASGKGELSPPDDGPDDDAQGFVKVKGGRGAEMIEIQIRKVDGDATYDVYLEDGDGVMQKVGEIEVEDGDDSGKWKALDRGGDSLPFDVDAVAELSGRRVEVRNESAEIVLEGTVP